MKNSPIIKVKNVSGEQVNLNANHVTSFKATDTDLVVTMVNNNVYCLDCTERSFRGYMNKAYSVSKDTDEA